MKSMRAQLSLSFTDEDLFDNFIVGLKENKELSGLVIRLLSSYYYNEEVQRLVEGFEPNEYSESNIIDSTEAFNRIRMNLAMQDYLMNELQSTVNDGVSSIEKIRQTNEMARDSVEKYEESSKNTKTSIPELSISDIRNNINNSSLENRVNNLETNMSEMMSMLKNIQETTSNIMSNRYIPNSGNQVEQKTSMQTYEDEVSLTSEVSDEKLSGSRQVEPQLSQDISNTYVDDTVDNVLFSSVTQPNQEMEDTVEKVSDDSNILNDLLSDMF